MTPTNLSPPTIGNAKAACRPSLTAIAARGKLSSLASSGIQHGFTCSQTRPGMPTPEAKVLLRLAISNSSTREACALQKLRHRSAVAFGSSDHIAPTSHRSVAPIVFSMRGVASLTAGDSARIRVIARLTPARVSFSSRISSETRRSSTTATRKRKLTALEATKSCRTISDSLAVSPTNGPRPRSVPQTAKADSEAIARVTPRWPSLNAAQSRKGTIKQVSR